MPDIKYLCIDDQKDNSVDILLEAITNAGGPDFERKTPVDVGSQIEQITANAALQTGKFGLMLDLRLDMETDVNGERVPYRGPTLAQELRTRMAENSIHNSFPIVLWSISSIFDKSYLSEDSAHDLFDAVYGKDEEITGETSKVAVEMLALVTGYKRICEAKGSRQSAYQLLGLSENDTSGIYASLLDELDTALNFYSVNQVARITLAKLIRPAGLLVTESLMAARLGVDIAQCKLDWDRLKVEFETACFKGPFSEGWPRWWWYQIEDWWSSLLDNTPNLRRTTAADRVQLLSQKFGLTLVAATPIDAKYSTKYFTLCVATQRPLDPIDGLRVSKSDKKPWHDVEYVSITAALNRVNKSSWGRIDPIDRDRYDSIKATTV